jgi:hypothetical protein
VVVVAVQQEEMEELHLHFHADLAVHMVEVVVEQMVLQEVIVLELVVQFE